MDAPQQPPAYKPILEPKDQLEMRVRAAQRAHDDEKEFGQGANQAAIKAGEETVKASLLINGGSAVAMLAFIGTLASKDTLPRLHLMEITKPLLWFGAGVALAAVGSAAAYFTNLMIAGASTHKSREYEHPFLRATVLSNRHRIAGEVFRYLAVAAIAASIGCFIVGLVTAKTAFSIVAGP